jgi:hypothetical protein
MASDAATPGEDGLPDEVVAFGGGSRTFHRQGHGDECGRCTVTWSGPPAAAHVPRDEHSDGGERR